MSDVYVVLSSGDEWVSDSVIGPFDDGDAANRWIDLHVDQWMEVTHEWIANGGSGYPTPSVFVTTDAVSPDEWVQQWLADQDEGDDE